MATSSKQIAKLCYKKCMQPCLKNINMKIHILRSPQLFYVLIIDGTVSVKSLRKSGKPISVEGKGPSLILHTCYITIRRPLPLLSGAVAATTITTHGHIIYQRAIRIAILFGIHIKIGWLFIRAANLSR